MSPMMVLCTWPVRGSGSKLLYTYVPETATMHTANTTRNQRGNEYTLALWDRRRLWPALGGSVLYDELGEDDQADIDTDDRDPDKCG